MCSIYICGISWDVTTAIRFDGGNVMKRRPEGLYNTDVNVFLVCFFLEDGGTSSAQRRGYYVKSDWKSPTSGSREYSLCLPSIYIP